MVRKSVQELEPYGPMTFANIKLDPNQKSSIPLDYSDVTYTGQTGWKWYSPEAA